MAITKVTEGVRTLGTGEVLTANMATDPTNASNLSTGSVPLAQLGNAPATDLDPVEDDIAVLGFQVAAANDLAKYSLRDQIVDTFQDATGIDASASTGETRNAAGKYWSGVTAASGGTLTNYTTGGNDYDIRTFTSSGTFDSGGGGSVDALVVAGGGGGGSGQGSWWGGGGGGAGGMLEVSAFSASGTYSITVGAGGAGGPGVDVPSAAKGVSGGNSIFGTFIAIGGGGGGYSVGNAGGQPVGFTTGLDGGSGGGGAGDQQPGTSNTPGGSSTQPSPAGSTGYGYAGGVGEGATNSGYAGGGGGAGSVGADKQINANSGAGTGRANSLQTNSNITYAAGGAVKSSTAGTANRGDGGGSTPTGSGQQPGADGGSGVVVIRYITDALGSIQNMTLVSTATTAEAGTTATGDIVLLYTPFAGTTVLNTNLKAYVSRDDGTTYTQATLTGKGSYSGTTQIASAHSLDISAQPAGVTMRWKIETLVQSVALETRINGVSLGWS